MVTLLSTYCSPCTELSPLAGMLIPSFMKTLEVKILSRCHFAEEAGGKQGTERLSNSSKAVQAVMAEPNWLEMIF